MSENQNRGINDFSKYDSMATEELEEILRLDTEMPEGQESDEELILYVMEVLAERKRNNGHTGKTAREAYESFKRNYMPETENDRAPVKTRCRCPRWVRSLTAAAAVVAILLVGSVTAKAFGVNIWKAVIQWTQETFHFGQYGDPDISNDLPYTSLQEALEQGKITTPLAPTWFPSGYEFVDVKIEQTPMKRIYKAKYISGEKYFTITVQDHLNGDPVFVEQSEELLEKYEASGIVYCIFKDVDLMKAKWITGSYECSISGNVTTEDLKMMIDSIEEG